MKTEEKKGKGKKKKKLAHVGKANIWKIDHDKDYARTYKIYMPINLIIQKMSGIINPL